MVVVVLALVVVAATAMAPALARGMARAWMERACVGWCVVLETVPVV